MYMFTYMQLHVHILQCIYVQFVKYLIQLIVYYV